LTFIHCCHVLRIKPSGQLWIRINSWSYESFQTFR